MRPDLGRDVRCFSVQNRIVIYRPLDDGIQVLLVVHGSRDLQAAIRKYVGRGEIAD